MERKPSRSASARSLAVTSFCQSTKARPRAWALRGRAPTNPRLLRPRDRCRRRAAAPAGRVDAGALRIERLAGRGAPGGRAIRKRRGEGHDAAAGAGAARAFGRRPGMKACRASLQVSSPRDWECRCTLGV